MAHSGMVLWVVVGLFVASSAVGCAGPNWRTGGSVLADDVRLGAALGDPQPLEAFEPASLPRFDRPMHLRPCCGFGVDIAFAKQSPLAYFSVENILGPTELGAHHYDSGAITVDTDLTKLSASEANGLVYTCRGGFIDIAHVRDNMDLTLYLFYRIAAQLPGPMVVEIDGDNSKRMLHIKQLPAALMQKLSRWEIARQIAEWAAFRLSIWHEVATYYGDQSVPGLSEKVSAFTPEDLYSNALGIRLAGAILSGQRLASRDEWNTLAEIWIQRALARLKAVSKPVGREAMQSVDGLWWSSKIGFDDWRAVTHRAISAGTTAEPWTLQRANRPLPAKVKAWCETATALPMKVAEGTAELSVPELADLEILPGRWAGSDFPWPGGQTNAHVFAKDFGDLTEAVRTSMRPPLGPGFDAP